MKKNTVFFLGAGASAAFGYPLTGALMVEAWNKLKKNPKKNAELIDLLQLIYPRLGIDIHEQNIPGIVEVLSLIDYSSFYGIPPHSKIGKNKLPVLKELMINALISMLIDYDNESWDSMDSIEAIQEENFIAFKMHIKNELSQNNVTFITTNYDLTIDIILRELKKIGKIDYGIPYRNFKNGHIVKSLQDAGIQYYKLHGSHNWMRCPICGFYYINPYGCISHQYFVLETTEHNTCECNDDEKLQPVMIAPSTIRDIRDPNLLQIWNAAQESIRLADSINFIGYSLPAEDIAIKSMLLRGLNANHKFRKGKLSVKVVQQSDASRNAYENLITRGELIYINEGLQSWLKVVK
ncbi:hypothetical protein EA772_15375 [Pedobacter sp. G11]|uniref:hypothetical protein n=1 Tax=Pedobacter sp. G11 TaxID=2482728 RepID=UPI000F5D5947|nr:hypothetical protein [Pedobacter sp. G11]AZI26654.1 hypothetical protein EA772_15375 [Pedobacter sp. G11]